MEDAPTELRIRGKIDENIISRYNINTLSQVMRTKNTITSTWYVIYGLLTNLTNLRSRWLSLGIWVKVDSEKRKFVEERKDEVLTGTIL